MATTLVIHPKDKSTDFLTSAYADRGWSVINDNLISNTRLRQEIQAHERIIMMGHGTQDGLFGLNRWFVSSRLVYLLREKKTVAIWCNADRFVGKYGLAGFNTGMIISEEIEAHYYCNHPYTDRQISTSNELFAKALRQALVTREDEMLQVVLEHYDAQGNPIIDYNRQRIYFRQ